jgi:nucleoside-diphosphate-sugar epimerase
MKILVTGGTGFVGYWLKQTAPKNIDIHYLSHEEYDNKEWMGESFDYIIHAANIDPVDIITCAQKNDARVLYVSSGAVYHRIKNDYGKNKVLWEKQMIKSGIDFSTARLFACCGYKLKWDNFALGTFIKNALNDEPLKIWGNGNMIRSYIYGSDLGTWFWKILFEGLTSEWYDVGSYRAVTMLELAREVLKNIDSFSEIVIENKHEFERAPIYLPKNIHKTEDLGLTLKVSFEEAISRSVKDYLNERSLSGL